ncbi:MAG: SpoIID/LytB domain-containing protein [Paludibacteraceae bacterium]|nr:SpoIID/LytB domain-containing protein [Paludibacteraceae bacterium]MBN2787084.1 SpoIID/LytB domain-containing protein [Paludibacteraceae bacterium]
MQPTIQVGIVSATVIHFIFNDKYVLGDEAFEGSQSVSIISGKIEFNGALYTEILFNPYSEHASFDLVDVVIGIGFHWERKEIQRFSGQLKFIVEGEKLTAINILPVEDYLLSVISSEMSATSSLELLKAHAVTSRSWLLAQLEAKKTSKPHTLNNSTNTPINNELVKWYDKDDHANFDVCADDHCQRYQGITKASTEAVREAIELTCGQVLMYENTICDARFSKCCGGIAELFENCWQPQHHPYLLPVEDKPNGGVKSECFSETDFNAFIRNPLPGDFCNTTDIKVLKQVLNHYDQETADFYRWTVKYTQAELALLIKKKSGIDFGEIIDLVPMERGISGRLIRLKIVGTKQCVTVGKELEIRKWLSESHLYSSAFVVDKGKLIHGVPETFTLLGAGWGHGVGLCQIGAAVMAEKGYKYKDILSHYFRNTELRKIY